MAKSPAVTVTKDDVKAVVRSMRELANTRILVGIPAEKGIRKGEPISNAALGYIHENGAPEVGIPARPWLHPSMKSVKKELVPMFKRAGQVALKGGDFRKNLAAIGLKAANAAKKKIQDGPFVPLKPSTIANRKRRGRTGTKPLLDTAQMRNAVTFVLRKGRYAP